jgi:hypothetical protein
MNPTRIALKSRIEELYSYSKSWMKTLEPLASYCNSNGFDWQLNPSGNEGVFFTIITGHLSYSIWFSKPCKRPYSTTKNHISLYEINGLAIRYNSYGPDKFVYFDGERFEKPKAESGILFRDFKRFVETVNGRSEVAILGERDIRANAFQNTNYYLPFKFSVYTQGERYLCIQDTEWHKKGMIVNRYSDHPWVSKVSLWERENYLMSITFDKDCILIDKRLAVTKKVCIKQQFGCQRGCTTSCHAEGWNTVYEKLKLDIDRAIELLGVSFEMTLSK